MVQHIISKATVDSLDEKEETDSGLLSNDVEISGSVVTSSSSDMSKDNGGPLGQAVDKFLTRKKAKGIQKWTGQGKQGKSGCFPCIYGCFINLFSRE